MLLRMGFIHGISYEIFDFARISILILPYFFCELCETLQILRNCFAYKASVNVKFVCNLLLGLPLKV